MKAIWKGAIGFGLVNIPVKLYSASQSSSLDFDMLDRKDHSRIKYKRINESSEKEVDWGNIVKGFLYKDNYVIMENEDFEEAAPEKTKLIDIHEFVNEEEIDTVYFETPYYMGPEKGGIKAYSLLREALKKSGKIGVSTFVLRNAEILAVIKPYENVLVLNKIRFAEELRSTAEMKLPPASAVSAAELKMALALIKQFTQKFALKKYKDDYADELMKVIKAKAAGKRTKVKKMSFPDTKNKDLVAQLKASLTATKKKKAS
ncbi:MAG: Ku protein [Fimbriimonadaceae bacterium]|nr:Ku protein [Chitinophagales bacterium]